MNTSNSKTNESNTFMYQFTDKLNLKNPNKNIALANLRTYYTGKNIKSEYKNNKFKIHAPTWNDEFDLPDESYSVSDIQDYFEVVLVHCNLVSNNYQLASKVLFTFVPNKQFGQFITIIPHSPTMLKATNAEFSFNEIGFTDQKKINL